MKVYDYEQLYKEERESHMVTENLYARALRELEELKRQTETSFYQHDNNDGKYEGLLAELETVHKARDELEDKVVDTQRALKECENDVSEMHAKFAEAVVTATQQASRCDVAERAVNRMEAVVSQLEADNSKLRNSKNEELDQYKEDLREVQAEVVLLTSRLRESETSRVQQSACISELTKNELLIDAAKRKCEQDLAAASKEVEKLRTASPQRVLANTDLQLYEAIDHSYSQMKTAVRMCLDMVTSLEQQSALTSSKLEALTVCVFDMSRQDRQLAQVVQNMSATSYAANRSTAEVKELQLENDRLSKLIEQAASQMLSFNEAVSLAEASRSGMLGDGPHIRTPLLTARQGYGGGIYDKRDKEQSSAVSTPPSVALSTLTPMMWVPPGFDRSVQHFTLEPTPSPAKNVNIALILSSILTGLVTVLDNTPYGLVLFPLVCRDAYSSVGVSMVLGAAAISQLTMTFTSKFPCAVGCMVVENLPFLTMMGREVTAILQARSEESKIVPTLIVLWALSTLLSGMAMGLLGATHAGRFTAYFPKHVLLGYVGGMGVFIFLSGIEITTNRTWTWTSAALSSQVEGQCGYRLMLTFLMSFLVPVVKMFSSGSPVALPCYFLSIPFVFWFCIYLFGFTADEARANEWVISVGANSGIPGLLPWTLVEPSLIAWDVLPTQMLTVAGLVLFTALHVPVNAPALGLTLGVSTDIDVEFRSHGIANMLTGAFGGLQSYMVYSTSALYHKCGGGGIIGGFIIAGITVFFAAGGNSVLSLLPRPLAGVVLIHLGFDLIYEVFIDSLSSITVMEYLQVVTVVVSMEVFGFMQGLGIGLLMACSAFIIAFASEDPIDVSSAGGGMRSKMMRPLKIRKKLDKLLERHAWILRVRGGSLFFGNSVRLLEHTETLLEIRTDLKFLVVHFTSLHGADCTAVSALAEIVTCCKRKNVIAVFAELPDDIIARVQHALESGQGNIYTCKCINDAFAWVEDKLLTSIKPPPPLVANRLFSILRPLVPDAGDDEISLLCKYFTRETHEAHTVLWKKGDDPSRALVVETGLLGVNCDEAFGLYSEFCKPGTICGELGLVTGESRQHDLVAIEDSVVWSFGKVGLKDPMVRSLFQQVALTMASHRLHHLTLLGHIHSV